MIFSMQIGFSMFEVGCVQAKSTKNVLIKNALDVCITSVCWATVGHGLAYGRSSSGVFGGTNGYFVGGWSATADFYASWLFNWTFVSTAATVVSIINLFGDEPFRLASFYSFEIPLLNFCHVVGEWCSC